MDAAGLVDVHHHIVPKAYVKSLAAKGVAKALGVQFPHWHVDDSLRVMDRFGISTAIVSISAPGVYFPGCEDSLRFARRLARQMNQLCASLIAEHPGRFGAFATLPLPDIDAACGELEYALDTLRFDGVVLLSNYGGSYLGDPRFDGLFCELNRRGATVFVHPATPPGFDESRLGFPESMMEVCFDTTRTVFSLIFNGVTRKYPEVRFILAHAGGTVPYIAGRISMLAKLFENLGAVAHIADGIGGVASVFPKLKEHLPPNLTRYLQLKEGMLEGPDTYLQRFHYDTALSASPHVFSSLLTVTDTSHIMFGSDYVFAGEAAIPLTIKGINDYAGFNPEELSGIGAGNAKRLFTRLAG